MQKLYLFLYITNKQLEIEALTTIPFMILSKTERWVNLTKDVQELCNKFPGLKPLILLTY
jgi:hypothetical protein